MMAFVTFTFFGPMFCKKKKEKKKKFWQSEDFFLKMVYMCTLHVLAVHIKYDVIVSRVKTLHSLKLLCDCEHYNCGFYHTLYIVVADGKS